jgi:hypothetical protein
MDSERFSLTALMGLPEVERTERLRGLEEHLAAAIAPSPSRKEFFLRGLQLIERLRVLGRDLWSFDSDGEDFEVWCGDYSPKGAGGPLTITFRYPGQVQVEWSTSRSAG